LVSKASKQPTYAFIDAPAVSIGGPIFISSI
jgi:hypothetical protein